MLRFRLTNIAFNAALIIFATLLIRQDPERNNLASEYSNQALTACLGSAIDALKLLDKGNRMVEKCTHHLQYFSQALLTLGMEFTLA